MKVIELELKKNFCRSSSKISLKEHFEKINIFYPKLICQCTVINNFKKNKKNIDFCQNYVYNSYSLFYILKGDFTYENWKHSKY